jgi:hypothetical protein
MNWTQVKDLKNDQELLKALDKLIKNKVDSILNQCEFDFDPEQFFKYMKKLIIDKTEGVKVDIQQELQEILEDEDKKILEGIFKWINTDLAELIMMKEIIVSETEQSSESEQNTAKEFLLKKKNALRNQKHSDQNKKLKKRRNSSFNSIKSGSPTPIKKVKQVGKPITKLKEKSISQTDSSSSEGENKEDTIKNGSLKQKNTTANSNRSVSKSLDKRY